MDSKTKARPNSDRELAELARELSIADAKARIADAQARAAESWAIVHEAQLRKQQAAKLLETLKTAT
jgi:hypothetical protein